VSLLISDQRMPEMTGAELLTEARRRSPETTRVFLTAYPEHVPLPEEVARWVISKPWDAETLRKVVRQLLRERELARRRRESPPPRGDWDVSGEAGGEVPSEGR
jgi:response regulator RpfG family c-di-GMP phosphodiesterase